MPRYKDKITGKLTPTYRSWADMKTRCTNPKSYNYKNYGAKGVAVCERWQKFENFYEDMGEKPSSEYVISRKEDKGNYEPGNCEWKTKLQNLSEAKTGSRHHSTDLNETDIEIVFQLREQGLTQREIGNRMKLNQSNISRILNKKTWKHVP